MIKTVRLEFLFIFLNFVNLQLIGCIDLVTNTTYGVGESWLEKETCGKYACVEAPVPNLPNVLLPTITRFM